MTYDFYLSTYGRNGYNGSGGAVDVYTSYNDGVENAGWNDGEMVFGGGGSNSLGAWVSLDVVGHEFTHGVTRSEADLSYSYESGALNESFSDIFGAMVEYYVEGSSGDYLLAEDFYIPDGKLRDMSDPNSKGQPDTYQGTYWYIGTGDNGGVHTNSGVQNFWFYLLSEGGSGTNDNGDAYSVSGIGRNSAAAIAYRALTVYLWSSSSYDDAKNACIFSAIDLFQDCGNEVLQTVNAWNAVGVSSDLGFGANGVVNCVTLNSVHDAEIPYTFRVINDMTADCEITPNGEPVTFWAGEQIELLPGFSSGDNFLARINPCVGEARMMGAGHDVLMIESKNDVGDKNLAEQHAFRLYPNPTTGELTVLLSPSSGEEAKAIRIFDISGRLIRETAGFYGHSARFDLHAERNGMYVVEMVTPRSNHRAVLVLAQ